MNINEILQSQFSPIKESLMISLMVLSLMCMLANMKNSIGGGHLMLGYFSTIQAFIPGLFFIRFDRDYYPGMRNFWDRNWRNFTKLVVINMMFVIFLAVVYDALEAHAPNILHS